MSYFKAEDWDKNDALLEGMQRGYDKSVGALRNTKWAKWRRAYLYLHCMHDTDDLNAADRAVGKEYQLESRLFRPAFAQQVLGLQPRLKDAMRGQNPPWRLEPVLLNGAPEDETTCWKEVERYADYLHYQLVKELRWWSMLDPMLMDALPYGQCVVRLSHVRRKTLAWTHEAVPGSQGEMGLSPKLVPQTDDLIGVQAEEEVENGLKAKIVPPWYFLPDMDGFSIRGLNDDQPVRYVQETSKGSIERIVQEILANPLAGWQYPKTIEGFTDTDTEELARQAAAKNESALRDLEDLVRKWLEQHEGKVDLQEDPMRKLQVEVKKTTQKSSMVDKEDMGVVPLLTFWGAGPDPWYIVRIGGSGGDILCKRRREQHPSLFAPIPHIIFKPMSLANELLGYGLIDLLDKLQKEENYWSNIILTAFKESMNGYTLVNKGAGGISAARLLGTPNRVVDVTNVGGLPLSELIHHVERPIPNLSAALQMLQMITSEFNQTGSLSEYLQGASPSLAGGTVRGYALAVDQGSRRMNGQSDNMGLQAGEMGEVMHGINRQYLTQAREFQMVGKSGPGSIVAVTTAMAQKRYDIVFNTNPVVVNEGLRLQNFVSFRTVNSNAPEFQQGEAIREHAKLLNLPNPERFVKTHPTDAQLENLYFEENGMFPWPPQKSDDHEYHDQEHAKMMPWAQTQGDPQLLMALSAHRAMHMQAMGLGGMPGMPGMPGATSGMPPEQGGPPGAPGAPAEVPYPELPPDEPQAQGATRSE